MNKPNLGTEIKHHRVALISLVLAIIALLHAGWRQDVSERNRNIRQAGFEVLKNLGELQVVVNQTVYQPNQPGSSAFSGWGHVALIGDLGSLLPAPVPEKTAQLVKVWGETWKKLQDDEAAQDSITEQIDANRTAVLDVIHGLW